MAKTKVACLEGGEGGGGGVEGAARKRTWANKGEMGGRGSKLGQRYFLNVSLLKCIKSLVSENLWQ